MGGPAKGGSLVACRNFKMFIVCAFLLFHLSSMSLWEIYLTLLLLVTISVSLLFGPCRMSEFTLAGPLRRLLQQMITWYKIMLESKVIIIPALGHPKQRKVKLDWLKLLCFGSCHILLPSSRRTLCHVMVCFKRPIPDASKCVLQ